MNLNTITANLIKSDFAMPGYDFLGHKFAVLKLYTPKQTHKKQMYSVSILRILHDIA